MITELSTVLKYKGFQEKFNDLQKTELIKLPENVENFVTETQAYEYTENKEETNRYHLYSEIFTDLRLEAALNHFRKNVQDVEISDEKIKVAYERLSEPWVSNYEDAEHEVKEFIKFVNLLK